MFDDIMRPIELRSGKGDARARDARATGPGDAAVGGASLRMLALGAGLIAAACGPGVRRDLSNVPVGQVGFDDLCGLQSYYDGLAIKEGTPPALIDAAEIERVSARNPARGGRARFAFETDFQLTTVKRILDENWKGLPPGLHAAKRIELNVTWSERAGLRRVANDSSPELVMDGLTVSLPYHVCLSELLFGDKIYEQRRELLGLDLRSTAQSLAVSPDAGAHPAVGATDGGVAPSSPRHSSSSDAGAPPAPAPGAAAAGPAGPAGGK